MNILMDVSVQCEYLYILVLRWFSEHQCICIFQWVRKGRLTWGHVAEKGVIKRGRESHEHMWMSHLLYPIHPVSFQNWDWCFSLLLALATFSSAVRMFPLGRGGSGLFLLFLWKRLRSWFYASHTSCFPSFFNSQALVAKDIQNRNWNNWFNHHFGTSEMSVLLLARESLLSQTDTFCT